MARKIFLQIHRWLGIASGLVVFIIGITGAIYAFEKELQNFFYKDFLETPIGSKELNIDTLLTVAQHAIGKEYPVSRIEVERIPGKAIGFYSLKADYEAKSYWNKIIYSKVAFVDPYTARITKVADIKWEFFTTVLAIHTSLLLGTTGTLIIGWSTVIFIVLLITGFILWYPKNKAAAKQRFWFKWKSTTKLKRKNYDLHNILGFYAMIFLLIIALTGLIWSFDWWEDSVMKWVNRGEEVKFDPPPFSDTSSTGKTLALAAIKKQISVEAQGRKKYFLIMPVDKSSSVPVVIPGDGRHRYKFIQLWFDQYSGKLISRGTLYEHKSPGEQLRNMNIDIHTGSILGFWGKLLAFLVSVIAAGLPVTGFIIWWGKTKKKKSKTAVAVKNVRVVQTP